MDIRSKDINELTVKSNDSPLLPPLDKGGIRGGVVFLVACYLLLVTVSHAEVLDRVAAYVDDTAVTLFEFRINFAKMREAVPNISEEEVLNSMINSLLLLKEAKKMRLDLPTKDEILKEYIDIKIKAAITIKEEDLERFYKDHKSDFIDKDYISVRDDIEKYLFELETNKLLKKHLEELRSNAEIRVQTAQ